MGMTAVLLTGSVRRNSLDARGMGMLSRYCDRKEFFIFKKKRKKKGAFRYTTTACTTEMQRDTKFGDILAIEMLLAIMVDTEEKDNYGFKNDHKIIVQRLLNYGVKLDTKDKSGTTPRHERVMQLPPEGGAAKPNNEQNAMIVRIAAQNGHWCTSWGSKRKWRNTTLHCSTERDMNGLCARC
ncbi:hypothetical protein BGX38DRAFT_650261 [Terfezia claveryi]|nr:hypothetical protein BGX38DRAFT_650261 [Terfezia claveryi]